MSKGLKITLIVLVSIMVTIMLALGIYFLFPWNSTFFDSATIEFAIPGLDTSFVPQGFSQIDEDKYIISGYMNDGSASRFYVVDTELGVHKYITLKCGGEDFVGHVGGVEIVGDTVWTASSTDKGGYCYRFSLSDVFDADNGDSLDIIDQFVTNNGADFVFAHNNMLWVGEFYRDGNYETDDSHHIQTRSGETNTAIVYGYAIDEDQPYGLASVIPQKALSVRGLCQGIAMTADGKFVMSTSYSIPDSTVYYYDSVLDEPSHSTITVGDVVVPLWFLDDQSLISTTNAPSMSEEVVVSGDKVYILFESACQKYRIFNRKQLSNVYSLPLSQLEK